jgi:hypothetical protein
MAMSPDAFLERYAPAAAANTRVSGAPRPLSTPTAAPSSSLPGIGLGIIAGGGQPRQPYQSKFHNQKEYDMTEQFDFAKLPPQIDRRLAIQTMMNTPQDTVVTYAGRQMLVSDALKHMMNGEGAAVVEPAQPAQTGQPIQPSHQAGPGGPKLMISQGAANTLPQAKYDELAKTGHIQGLTNSDNGRAVVHVRNSSGTVESRFAFNPETGAVEPGRPMDTRMFHDPSAGDSK